jgi:23S rRNA (pseudouridine1915-N3)-methyltransferase
MNIHLIAAGQRMPEWVESGFQEYARRMTGDCRVRLVEIALRKRKSNHEVQQSVRLEGEQMLNAVPPGAHIVALDITGNQWSTGQLAQTLEKWLAMGKDVALLIGGPEGLAPECKAAARESWGLSKLTFPHPLVRIIVVEQLYRAWSVLQHHPYHRQ